MVRASHLQSAGAESRLQSLGIQLPASPTPLGTYVEALQTGSLLFLSGMLPVVDRKPKHVGRLGKELDAEAGRDATRTAALGALAAAKEYLGSLDRITRVVRLGVMMATSGDFSDQPRVADAASDLFHDIFGPDKTSVRLVFGVASLPLGVPVELEVIFEISDSAHSVSEPQHGTERRTYDNRSRSLHHESGTNRQTRRRVPDR